MKPTTHRSHVLAALAVLPAVLESDEQGAPTQRRRRDRAIGKGLKHLAKTPLVQVLEWLVCMGMQPKLERARTACYAVVAVLIATGLLIGGAAAVGAFFYDGTTRVNVVAVLAVFVGLQTVLLVLVLVSMLPEHALGWLPGAEAITAILRMLSPGRIALVVHKLLPVDIEQTLRQLGRASNGGGLTPRLRTWIVIACAQYLALAFNAGAVFAALCLVVFSDIAFGWATTLALGATEFHRLVEWVALPWSEWLPTALPSIELIEASRYYRLEDAEQIVDDPKLLGQWWPFVVASMVTYGLVPRVLTLALALNRLRRAGEHALLVQPGVAELIERLNTTLVETQSEEPETAGDDARSAMAPSPRRQVLPKDLGAIIDWADVPVAQHWLDALGDRKPPCVVYQAGGGRTLESDQAVVDAIRDASNDGSVAVLTKGFEPPLLELDDFLDALRKAIGQQRDIIIVPLDAPGRELPQAHRQRWQHMVENRRDAKLHLADVGTGPTDD